MGPDAANVCQGPLPLCSQNSFLQLWAFIHKVLSQKHHLSVSPQIPLYLWPSPNLAPYMKMPWVSPFSTSLEALERSLAAHHIQITTLSRLHLPTLSRSILLLEFRVYPTGPPLDPGLVALGFSKLRLFHLGVPSASMVTHCR